MTGTYDGPAIRHWLDDRFYVFDTETTDHEPETARIVSASLSAVTPAAVHSTTWLVDPGVEIPAEATAINGLTTEHVREHGRPAVDAVPEIGASVAQVFTDGWPLVVMNATYDLTLVDCELTRLGLPTLGERGQIRRVIDPFVIDKAVDTYRKGSRTLGALCDHYGVRIDGAHDATADALAAGRVMWAICRRYPEVARLSPDELHTAQIGWYRADAASFQSWLKRQANPGETVRVVDTSWPLRSLTLDSVAS